MELYPPPKKKKNSFDDNSSNTIQWTVISVLVVSDELRNGCLIKVNTRLWRKHYGIQNVTINKNWITHPESILVRPWCWNWFKKALLLFKLSVNPAKIAMAQLIHCITLTKIMLKLCTLTGRKKSYAGTGIWTNDLPTHASSRQATTFFTGFASRQSITFPWLMAHDHWSLKTIILIIDNLTQSVKVR